MMKFFGQGKPWDWLQQQMQEKGPVFLSFWGPIPRLVVTDMEMVQDILVRNSSHNIRAAIGRNILKHFLGTGLLFAEKELWKRQRKLIAPAFHFHKLKDMVSSMVNCSDAFVTRWIKQAEPVQDNKGWVKVDVHKAFLNVTLDIICSCAFGFSMDKHRDIADLIHKGFKDIVNEGALQKFLASLPGIHWLPLSVQRKMRANKKAIENVALKFIREREQGNSHSLSEGAVFFFSFFSFFFC